MGVFKGQTGFLVELVAKTLTSCGDNHVSIAKKKYDPLNEKFLHCLFCTKLFIQEIGLVVRKIAPFVKNCYQID